MTRLPLNWRPPLHLFPAGETSTHGSQFGPSTCEMLAITQREELRDPRSFNDPYGQESRHQRPIIVILGRTHPCEASGSWALQGLLRFLCGKSRRAADLRHRFEFICMPILSQVGVLDGCNHDVHESMEYEPDWYSPWYPGPRYDVPVSPADALRSFIRQQIAAGRLVDGIIEVRGDSCRCRSSVSISLEAVPKHLSETSLTAVSTRTWQALPQTLEEYSDDLRASQSPTGRSLSHQSCSAAVLAAEFKCPIATLRTQPSGCAQDGSAICSVRLACLGYALGLALHACKCIAVPGSTAAVPCVEQVGSTRFSTCCTCGCTADLQQRCCHGREPPFDDDDNTLISYMCENIHISARKIEQATFAHVASQVLSDRGDNSDTTYDSAARPVQVGDLQRVPWECCAGSTYESPLPEGILRPRTIHKDSSGPRTLGKDDQNGPPTKSEEESLLRLNGCAVARGSNHSSAAREKTILSSSSGWCDISERRACRPMRMLESPAASNHQFISMWCHMQPQPRAFASTGTSGELCAESCMCKPNILVSPTNYKAKPDISQAPFPVVGRRGGPLLQNSYVRNSMSDQGVSPQQPVADDLACSNQSIPSFVKALADSELPSEYKKFRSSLGGSTVVQPTNCQTGLTLPLLGEFRAVPATKPLLQTALASRLKKPTLSTRNLSGYLVKGCTHAETVRKTNLNCTQPSISSSRSLPVLQHLHRSSHL